MRTKAVPSSQAGSASAEEIGRAQINLDWLFKLRRAAFIGQFVTIVTVRFVLGIDLPLGPLFLIVAATALSSQVFETWFRRRRRRGGFRDLEKQGAILEGSLLVIDTLILTALLYVSGGPTNPFAIFYIVHIVLAAVLLGARWAIGLTLLSALEFWALFVDHVRLPALDVAGAEAALVHDVEKLRLHGFFVAFCAAASIIVYFVARVRDELERREHDLDERQRRRDLDERVQALVTLAAGAAHELATPLSTIAVVARELEVDLESRGDGDSQLLEDVRLIRNEVTRCRAILDQMAGRAGESGGEEFVHARVGDLLAQVVDPLRAGDRVRLDCAEATRARHIRAPMKALKRALRGLVKNALDASDPGTSVRVAVTASASHLDFEVHDAGEGMSEEVLQRAGNPFFTTKPPGAGMGLGLYLARSVIERLGGRLVITSQRGAGTQVRVSLPLTPA